MRFQKAVLVACLLFTTSLFAAQSIAPIGAGNALTLPAQRHVVRLEPAGGSPVWLLALQQEGQEGRGLGFFRSNDEGLSWNYEAPIQNDSTHRDTADLLPVGADVALVYSYEAPSISGSTRHDVYFQWWRFQEDTRSWAPTPAVRVFDSVLSTTGYTRAELARDSQGRLWVQAFRLEPDGTHTAVISVSEDEGLTFQPQPSLANLPQRGGGRLLHLGDRLIFVYGHHGVAPAWFRVRMDSAPLGSWQPQQQAFSEGIYHGAALSAVALGGGRMHLVYKSVDERLFHRAFDGTAFGPATLLQSPGDWALQPAATLVGDELVVFYNSPVTLNTNYTLAVRRSSGGSFSTPEVLESSVRFRGYPAAPEFLPASATRVPCFYGDAPDASSPGMAVVSFLQLGALQPGLEVVHTNTTHRFLAVAPSGTAYALRLDDSPSRLYVSTDGARTWTFKARHTLGGSFYVMSALSDGTLLANTSRNGHYYLSRSGDGGATWSEVLLLDTFRMLTPHNIAELDGTVYLIEYQAFTTQDTPIRLYASTDRGRTWQVRYTFLGHRHGHGLAADPTGHALWAFFGDTTRQSGTYRSTDGGRTWTRLLAGQEGCVVDATVLGNGSLLFGQDISYLPSRPHVAQLSPTGTYVELALLTGPAYSTYAAHGGGFVVGSAREPGGDIYPPGEVSAHVWTSLDGVNWMDLLRYPRLSSNDTVRADVYYELPSGLLVLQLRNAQGFGAGGEGYQLLRLTSRSASQ